MEQVFDRLVLFTKQIANSKEIFSPDLAVFLICLHEFDINLYQQIQKHKNSISTSIIEYIFIDSFRYYIENIVPKDYKKYFLARLITEASVHVNTSGVFKGFYKDKETGLGKFGGTAGNALSRITGDFDVSAPVLSNFQTESCVFREDANIVSKKVKNLDITYLDPPYNQHPYGSNYFMLNLILDNKMPSEISKVSGIPTNWNHSIYNKKQTALNGLEDIVSNLDSKYCIFSYNNEGFISKEDRIFVFHIK